MLFLAKLRFFVIVLRVVLVYCGTHKLCALRKKRKNSTSAKYA